MVLILLVSMNCAIFLRNLPNSAYSKAPSGIGPT
jgi:hypothetical protein